MKSFYMVFHSLEENLYIYSKNSDSTLKGLYISCHLCFIDMKYFIILNLIDIAFKTSAKGLNNEKELLSLNIFSVFQIL